MNKNTRNNIIIFIVCIIVMGATFFVSRNCLIVFPVKGPSMQPTLYTGDRVVVYRTKKLDYGDVIVFYYPPAGKNYVKRVIGLSGDTIDIQYDYDDKCYKVSRNGVVLEEESYIKEKMVNYESLSMVIPEGKIFFLGDNRMESSDSHINGALADIDDVEGVVFFKYGGEKTKFIN